MNYRKDLFDRIIGQMIHFKRVHPTVKPYIDELMTIVYQEYHKPLPVAREGSLGYNDQNWADVLASLNLKEQAEDAYGVTYLYDMTNNYETQLHYEDEDQKRELYTFLTGVVYQKMRTNYGQLKES